MLKLLNWVVGVELEGLDEMRKVHGFHDEPLKGKRLGQRSIRFNQSYRAIYTIHPGKVVRIIRIEEVNKHEYYNEIWT